MTSLLLSLLLLAGLGCTKPPTDPLVAELREILASRNDNDPRLDRDFDRLTAEQKRLFRSEYAALPPERRNERGTIVYLLGRSLSAPEDWEFLRKVAAEPPCLSLADCSKPAATPADGGADEVTLAYPSLVALRQAQRAAAGPQAEALAASVLKAGAESHVPAVRRLAARLGAR